MDISGATAGASPEKSDAVLAEGRTLVARNVARLRRERGLSISDLARSSRVSKQTVWKIERGEGNPTVDTLADLAVALRVSMRTLLTEFGRGILVERGKDVTWHDFGTGSIRDLYQVYGSGYVRSAIIRVSQGTEPAEMTAESPGSFHYLYLIDGEVLIRQGEDEVTASDGDFVRISGAELLQFESVTDSATVHSVTTFPQLRSSGA